MIRRINTQHKIQVKSNDKQLFDETKKAFIKGRTKAVIATVNEIIKYTLPSSPTQDTNFNKKSASKIGNKIKKNIKDLRKRILKDIAGGQKKHLPTGTPANKQGTLIKETKQGYIRAGFIIQVVHLKKTGKRAKKIKLVSSVYTDDPNKLIDHIKQVTKFIKPKGKVARRLMKKGSKIMWVKNKEVAWRAALKMSIDAGSLLSGWRALQDKVMRIKAKVDWKPNLLRDVMEGVTTRRNRGQGSIQQRDDFLRIRAVNNNVQKPVENYQQEVVTKTVKTNLPKHFQNELKYFIKKMQEQTGRIKKMIKVNK